MFKNHGRRVWIGAPSLVLLVVVLWLARGDWTGRAEQWLTEATGAPVTVGQARWRLLGGPGLVLRDCRLRGALLAGGLASWEVDCDRVELACSWVPWRGESLRVRSLQCSGPRLRAMSATDTLVLAGFRWRFEDLQWGPSGLRSATFDGHAQELREGRQRWQDVRGRGSWSAGRLRVAELAGHLGGGTAHLSGELTAVSAGVITAVATLRVEDVPAQTFFAGYWPELADHLQGPLVGHARGQGRWRPGGWETEAFVADGEATVRDGVMRVGSWLGDADRFLGKSDDLRNWTFSRLQHRFQLQGRRYRIEALELEGKVEAQAAGWIDVGGNLDVTVGLRLPPGFTPDLGALSFVANSLRDGDGRIRLGLDLTGPAQAPRVGVNLGRGRRR